MVSNDNNNDFSIYKDKGLTGLANLGNTCFLNSTMQCLSHTYELNELLNNKKKLNSMMRDNIESIVLKEWDKLRELMWKENCGISPAGFVKNVHHIAEKKGWSVFTGFAQNDLPEFLIFLMDCFHESIKREVKMNINGTSQNDTDVLAEKCYKMIKKIYSKEYSEIIKLFYGITVSEIQKISGETLSITPEPQFMFHVPLCVDKPKCTLYDCFDLFTTSEELGDDNKWYYEKEDKHINIKKQIKIFSLPEILIISLKRFNNRNMKNNMLVEFPIDNLDLSKYICGYDDDIYKYDLYGVCNHMGSSMGGHYTAYVKNANNKWYLFNDIKVNEIIDKTKIVSNSAYCLFYRKKK